MAAPKGNQNAKGNPGGGRKSAYEEGLMAELLKKAFFEGVNTDELKKSLSAKQIKLFDVTLQKALTSERMLIELVKKLYPDKHEHSGGMENSFDVTLTTIDAKDTVGKDKKTG